MKSQCVPLLIMRLPEGFDKRGDIPQLVQNIDYAPTFLELAGVSVPSDIQGVSLLLLLKESRLPIGELLCIITSMNIRQSMR